MGSFQSDFFVTYDISMKYSVMDSEPKMKLWTHQDNPKMKIQHNYVKPSLNEIWTITYQRDMSVKTVEGVKNNNIPVAHVKHILEFPNDFLAINFHIKVKRTELIYIEMKTHNTLNIFDGPGIFSPKARQVIRNGSRVLYQSTTFQVVCFMKMNVLGTIRFVFAALKLDGHNLRVSSTENIHYPKNSICNNYYICILTLSTKSDRYLKLEIQHFIFRGPLSSECVFGGYFAYDNFPDKEIYNTHNCITQDDNYIHRNIYSETNDLVLVLFHYKEYSKHIDMKLKATTSKCLRLTVNICKESNFNINLNTIQDCLVVQPYSSSLNQARCDTLLHPVLEKTVKHKIVTTFSHLEGFLRTFHKEHNYVHGEFLSYLVYSRQQTPLMASFFG